MMLVAPKRKTTRLLIRRLRTTEEAPMSERELLVELRRALMIALKAIEKRLETVKDQTKAA